jgi:hypothetical protein
MSSRGAIDVAMVEGGEAMRSQAGAGRCAA